MTTRNAERGGNRPWKIFSPRMLLVAVLIGTAGLSGGCAMLHSLHPGQWHKLNRGPKLGRDTENFSVPDDSATRARGWDRRMDALLEDE